MHRTVETFQTFPTSSIDNCVGKKIANFDRGSDIMACFLFYKCRNLLLSVCMCVDRSVALIILIAESAPQGFVLGASFWARRKTLALRVAMLGSPIADHAATAAGDEATA